MTPPRRLWRVVAPVALACLALVGGMLVQPTGAVAASGTLGTLSLSPASGTATDGITVTTVSSGATKGCPAGSTGVIGKIIGPGWSVDESVDAFAQPSTTISTSAEFGVPMVATMAGIATQHSLTIVAGTYTITMSCQSAAGANGTFVGELTFTSATAWASGGPSPSTTAPTTAPGTTATPTPTASPTPGGSTSGTPTASSTAGSGAPTGTLGSLSIDPATGTDIEPFSVLSHATGSTKGCPTTATNVNGFITGPGDWTTAKGIQAFPNTAISAVGSQKEVGELQVPMSNSMNLIAANYSIKIVAGRYDITLYCQNNLGTTKFGTFIGSVWFTDPTHYQDKDPATSQSETKVALTVAPQYRADVGAELVLTATVSPPAAVGKVQFQESTNGAIAVVGTPVDVASGVATLKLTTLPFGLHTLSAVFTPTDPKVFKAATSGEQAMVLARGIPPLPPSAATISGTARVGSSLTCAATFQNATSTSFGWVRNRTAISGATGRTYTLVAADRGTAVRCKALATNSGGTTSRTSRAVAVS